MTSAVLAGGRLASAIKARVSEVAAEWDRDGIQVTLAVVVATADESTLWYVRSIASAAAKAGIHCRLVDLGDAATGPEIAKHLVELSNDPTCTASSCRLRCRAELPPPGWSATSRRTRTSTAPTR